MDLLTHRRRPDGVLASRMLMIAAGALALAVCGCQSPGTRLPPAEEVSLETRALDLLSRAAESDLDVLRANALEALVRVDPDMGRPHFRSALDSQNPLVRYAGCMAVGDVRDSSALPLVRRLLDDADPRVRLASAYAAYRCGFTDAGRTLLSTMNDSPDEKMRAEAAYLIGKLGDKKAMKALVRATDRETSGYVVVHMQTAMAMLGDERMVDKLIEYILKSDSVTRIVALQSLCELRDDRARRALQYRMADKSDYLESRLLAARGLGRLGLRDGYMIAYQALNYRAGEKQDANDQMRVRTNAALALGSMGDHRALSALRDLASSDSDERVQVAASLAILQIMRGETRDR